MLCGHGPGFELQSDHFFFLVLYFAFGSSARYKKNRRVPLFLVVCAHFFSVPRIPDILAHANIQAEFRGSR